MAFIDETEALVTPKKSATAAAAPGGFITEFEALGVTPPLTTWERFKQGASEALDVAQKGYDWLTKPILDESNSSVFERGQKMTPPTMREYQAAAPYRESVAALPKAPEQPDRPTGLQVVSRGVSGTVPQLADMLTSTGKQLFTLPVYAAGYAYQRSQGVSSDEAAKTAMKNKDLLLPDTLFAPWRTIAENLGGEVKQAYDKNPVAWVLGQIGELVSKGGEATANKLGVPAEHFAALTDEVMGLLGAKAFKPQVAHAVAGRLQQMSGLPKLEGMGGFGELKGAPRERVTPDMTAPQVKAVVEAALKDRNPLDTIWPPVPKPVKVKAEKITPLGNVAKALTDESVYVEPVRPRRTPGEFGPEPVQGPPAPKYPEPPPAMRPLILTGLDKQRNGLLVSSAEAKALRSSGLDAKTTTPLVMDALDKLRDGQLISTEQARALRTLKVDVDKGVIRGPQGQVLFQKGKADPALLGTLAMLGLGAAAAPGLVDWWNNSGGLSGDNSGDFVKGLAAIGAFGMLKGEPIARALETKPFVKMELPAVIETYRTATGRSKELAAAKIWEDTQRQLTKSVQNMVRDQGLPVEDIVQTVYMKAFEALDKPVDAPGGFRGDSTIQTWLHQTAKRSLYDMYNKPAEQTARRSTQFAETASPDGESGTKVLEVPEKYSMQMNPERYKSAYDEAAQSDLGRELVRAMEKLPEHQRAVVHAVELEGLSYAEAGEMLGIPENTVRSQLSRAKESMRQTLSIYGDRQAGKATTKDMMRVGAVAGGAALGAVYADDPHKGAIVGGLLALSAGLLGTDPAKQVLRRSTTALADIYAPLRRASRDMEREATLEIAAASNTISNFIKQRDKLPPDQAVAFTKAYKEADPAAQRAALANNPEALATFDELRKMLDNAAERLVAEGRFKEGIPDYLPLRVKDFKGLMEHLGKPVQEGLAEVLRVANYKAQKKLKRDLNELERNAITTAYLVNEPATSYLPNFAKSRRLRMTEETAPFYDSLENALIHYTHAMVTDLAETKFFGRDLATMKSGGKKFTDVESSISNLVNRALDEGHLTPEQAVELQDVFRSRFIGGEKSPAPWLQDVRNISGIGLLGQIGSGVVQISETLLSTYHHGIVPALKAAGTLATGRGIKASEFGLANHVIEEVIGQRPTGKALSLALKVNLLAAIDQLGMKQNLTASYIKNKQLSQTPRGQAQLMEKWGADYGPDMPRVIQELQESTMTNRSPLVESLLYQELSDIRPTSRMESTPFHNAHPNARIFYHLKHFMLTQADILYRDSYKKIQSGNPRQVAIGFKNLALYAAALSVATVPADAIKDWIMGRELKLDKIDYVDNFMRNFGINRYSTDKVAESATPGKAMLETAEKLVKPPALSIGETVLKGLSEPKELVPLVPLAGRAIYNRELGGNEKAEISDARKENLKAKKEGGPKTPLSPAAKQYLREKRMERKRKQIEERNK